MFDFTQKSERRKTEYSSVFFAEKVTMVWLGEQTKGIKLALYVPTQSSQFVNWTNRFELIYIAKRLLRLKQLLFITANAI